MDFIHKVAVKLFNGLFPCKVINRENVPNGAAVFICNHFRAIDCGFVADVYDKDIYFLAKKELFDKKFVGGLVKSFGAVPIDRQHPDLKSMLGVIRLLKKGSKLAVFPEGTRNKTGTTELQELKSGSAIFAINAKCPVVPLIISRKARAFRRTYIIVGKPFTLESFYGKKLSDEDFNELNVILRDKLLSEQKRLFEILNKKNHGNSKK